MNKKENRSFFHTSSFRIVLVYLVVGGFWIVFSDKLLLLFSSDIHTYLTLQTYKGTFYVFSTAVLLYFLVKGEFRRRDRIERELTASLLHQEELTRELHHRVKNNLQIIQSVFNLQKRELGSRTEGPVDEGSMRKLSLRIQTISLFHEKIYLNSTDHLVPLDAYLLEISQQYRREFENELEHIRLDFDFEESSCAIDIVQPIGFIFNELMMNAIEHGPEKTSEELLITGRLRKKGNEISLTVSNTGRNFDPEGMKEGLGYSFIRSLLVQTGGSMEFSGEGGMKIMVRVPCTEAKE